MYESYFLDIDGVLNCAKTITSRIHKQENNETLDEYYQLQKIFWNDIISNKEIEIVNNGVI